ncbi:glycerophosphodiester phosphodiesterase [Paenibacillus thermotolerans]|uniref:glycerophosphodiester phosphodiesterase n=1 Tax=Paenibacillus thermotolerans TaxID=3027807 RepID=UPI002367945A|nr:MULTISPECIES: glycerophosphodiester phosphodiesterase family protein [unclassified Paenibacillus]
MNPIVAHRGWSGKAPENTMAAFRLALSDSKIAGIELDVQLTKDGVPVVIHDYTVDRCTNGKGMVKDYTLQELRKLDAGSWFGKQYAGEQVPTLHEALAAMKGKVFVNIELKSPGGMYPGLEEEAIRIVRGLGMDQDVYFTSFDHEVIREASRLAPDIRTGLLFSGRPILLKEQFRAAGAAVLSIAYPFLTPGLVEEARENGIGIMAWTVDVPEHIKLVAQLGSDIQICTNVPDRAFQALGR